MAQSIKLNFVLNLINIGTQMLFPLITFPYVCRVIGPSGIGQVSFFQSIIAYITLFTCLGIPMYGVREIARVRNNVVKMNRTAMEILLLNLLFTFIGYVVVAILCFVVPQIHEDIPLFLVLSLTILFTAFGCEWFYQGIEDFKYITIRGLVVKAVSLVLLFLFVKSKQDLLIYGFYVVFGILGGNIFNFLRLRKYIKKENVVFSQLKIFRHVKPVLIIFSFNAVTSIYLQLNPVFLGFLKDSIAVGYFAAATKIMGMVKNLSVCLGTVMMPRVSNLLAENKNDEFHALIQKSYDFTLLFSLPITLGVIIASPYLIRVLCSAEFEPAVLTSQIVAPIVLIVGIANVIGVQALYPLGKIKLVTYSCCIGALFDLIFCFVLIPILADKGAALSYLIAEIVTAIAMYCFGKKYLSIKFFKKQHLLYAVGVIFMSVVVAFIPKVIKASDIMILSSQAIVGIVTYFAFLILAKDDFTVTTLAKLIKKI